MADDVEGGLGEPEGLQPASGSLRLAAPEDDWTRADWEAAAAAVLRKGGRLPEDAPDDAVWEALAHTTYDGLTVPPLGTRELLADLQTSGRPCRAGDWDVRTFAAHGPEQQVNRELREDVAGGATSVWVEVSAETDVAALLDGISPADVAVVLQSETEQAAVARTLLRHATSGLHPHTNLGIDARRADASLAAQARDAGVLGFVVDAGPVHAAGAGDVQELGWAMARSAAYLRRMEEDGVPAAEAAALLELRLAVTDVQLVSIAKLRAARRLWARMLELSGVEQVPLRLHAVTSSPMTSRYDPWVNLLRGTVAAFSAGVGGADAVTVLPFDTPLGRPDAFGRRMARNVSALLLAEAHLGAVTDPAGGAYAVERLTDDLTVAAWAELGRIETDGEPAFDQRVLQTARRRREDVAHRRLPITGLSEYPHLGETLPERAAQPPGAPRYGADFEALRAEPPSGRVFLATLGPVAAHTARAQLAVNLLAAGGVAADVAGATTGVEDLLASYGGQAVVCLAGTDAAYDEWGTAAAAELRRAGARRVLVVSPRPAADLAWADEPLRQGIDAVDFLTRTREVLS